MLSLPILVTGLLSAALVQGSHMEVKRAQHRHQQEAERSLDDLLALGTEAGELQSRATEPCPADHANWVARNAETWWKVDPTQQDHDRYHAYLSMSAYGDYAKQCPKTFPGNFTLLGEFKAAGKPYGQDGYWAKIPAMNKVVLVFKGNQLEGIDLTPVSIEDFVTNCKGCKAAKGVVALYKQAKAATKDWAEFKKAVDQTGLLASVTGHGIGGGVAILAGLDLGGKDKKYMGYAHNHGTPRLVNYQAMYRYDRIFQMEAGQSVIARNDYMANAVPAGNFCHVGQKAHITGDKTQWWTNCYGYNENATCLGTSASQSDHTYYFTAIGTCGSANKGF